MKAINNLDPCSADNLRNLLAEVVGQPAPSVLDLLNTRTAIDHVDKEKKLA